MTEARKRVRPIAVESPKPLEVRERAHPTILPKPNPIKARERVRSTFVPKPNPLEARKRVRPIVLEEAKPLAQVWRSPPFKLEDWYPSEPAKRSFGRICQAVNEQGTTIRLLGTRDKPLLVLGNADSYSPDPNEVELTIDEAKADWSAVTTAAAIYGTRFRISSQKVIRAVLFRHPGASHPAERYLRSRSADIDQLARQMEALAREVRKLAQKFTRLVPLDFEEIVERLRASAVLIDRRFREPWRIYNGLPAEPRPVL
jgi:hypothetical protein